MSFKREGDDKSWLNLLRKRRISELHAVEIPENEAFFMRDGRFACLVCKHRPIFDTVQVLQIHRQGNKHQAAQSLIDVPLPSTNEDVYHPHKKKFLAIRKNYDDRQHGKNVGKKNKERTKEKALLERLVNEVDVLSEKNEEKARLLNLKPYNSKLKYSASLKNSNENLSDDACSSSSVAKNKSFSFRKNEPDLRNTSIFTWNTPEEEDTTSSKGNFSALDTYADVADNRHTVAAVERGEEGVESRKKYQTPKVLTPAESSLFLKNTQAGWVRTREGRWEKGEGAEFDSDEETPPDLC